MKENYGDLKALEELGKSQTVSFTTQQLINEKLKNIEGESRAEVSARMDSALNEVLLKNKEKQIAIVSHGAAIKFLLMRWCRLNDAYELEYNNKIITVNSPGVIKLCFQGKELIDLEQIV